MYRRVTLDYRNLRKASFKLKFCTKCEIVYERFFADINKQIKYYQDFITIGLKREPCNEC